MPTLSRICPAAEEEEIPVWILTCPEGSSALESPVVRAIVPEGLETALEVLKEMPPDLP